MYLRSFLILGVVILLGIWIGVMCRNPIEVFPRENSYHEDEKYFLYDPEMAPPALEPQVMRGFDIMTETKRYLPQYAGNKVSCTNCHFSAGNSFGGRSNGLSLVGAAHKYPKILQSGDEYTLAERMNSCFMRSLNGKPLPLDCEDMEALVAYLEWISKGIPANGSYPWTGAKKLPSNHIPDPEKGAYVYEMQCSPCHGDHGEGQERPYDLSYPPLWGENSFNDSAGMNRIETFAYFVYKNMPYNDPRLTMEEALDVAAFVTSRPRPKFISPKE